MCKFEIWYHSCGHSEDKTPWRHFGYCDEVSRVTAQIEYPCKTCRERAQVPIVERWRRERHACLVQADILEGKGESSRPAKDKLSSLHSSTSRALHALKVDDPYRGLTFGERSVLRVAHGKLAMKGFFS